MRLGSRISFYISMDIFFCNKKVIAISGCNCKAYFNKHDLYISHIWSTFAAQKLNYRIKSFVILIEAIIAGEDDWVKPPSYPVIFCG